MMEIYALNLKFLGTFVTRSAIILMLLGGSASAQFLNSSTPEAAPAASADSTSTQKLLDVLKDEEARAALVADLENLVAQSNEASGAQDKEADSQTLARKVANFTAGVAEETFSGLSLFWRDLTGLSGLFSDLNDGRSERISGAWPPLLLTIISTIFILWAITRLTSNWLVKRQRPNPEKRLVATLASIALNAVADAFALAIAYAAGSMLALLVFGGGGKVLVEQSLYLNAFLIAGIIRIILRVFVHPDRPEMAISQFSSSVQKAIYSKSMFVTFLIVYGVNVAVPIAEAWLSPALGRSIRVIVVTLAVVSALFAIRKIHAMLHREALNAQNLFAGNANATANNALDETGGASLEAVTSVWSRVWPWLAGAYVVATYIIAISQPQLMADLIGLATLKTLAACGLIALAFRLNKFSKTAQLPIPKVLVSALPQIKIRLDGFAPLVMKILAGLCILIAFGLLLNAWLIVDVSGWIVEGSGRAIIWNITSALFIVGAVVVLWAVIASWIDTRLSLNLAGENVNARGRTLLALFRNAFTVAICIFGTMIALSQLGIDIAPLLAGAGVIGLAIGFGSQKLVQDIITGVFIQLENAMNEGDIVSVGGFTGVIEKLTIRSAGLRDVDGIYHLIPFSAADTVSNYTRDFSYHVEVVGVAYKEKIPEVKDAMVEAFERLKLSEHGAVIIDDLEMHGVVALSESSVDVRVRIKTIPGKQMGLGRAYTELVKEVFDERDIQIPFPHRQLIMEPAPQEA